MSRKLKKIFLKIEWISLEIEELDELFAKYNKEFENDFHDELIYINSSKTVQKKEPASAEVPVPQQSLLAQKIYRNLAKKMHPDVSTLKNSVEEFKNLSNYYENDDLVGLVSISNKHNIVLPDLCDKELLDIENRILQKENQINQKRSTLAWTWATSKEDKDKLKKVVYQTLNLDEDSFLNWKKKNNYCTI